MTYTLLAVVACLIVVGIDVWGLRTRLIASGAFWLSYAIVAFFQLLTNAVLTGREVVRYNGDAIVGVGNTEQAPELLGDWRIAFAPVEDLGFGFAFILLTISVWVWLGRRGLQPDPESGPPRWRSHG